MPLIDDYDTPPGYDPDAIELPPGKGLPYDDRIKGNELQRLVRLFAGKIAPEEIREHEIIRPFLENNKLKGTNLEVVVARAYSKAMYSGDINAMRFIGDILNDQKGSGPSVVINFIAPSIDSDEEIPAQTLQSDSWNGGTRALPGPSNDGKIVESD